MDIEHVVMARGVVDLGRRRLQRPDGDVRLTGLDLRLLQALVARSPDTATHHELLAEVWGYGSQVRTQALEQAVRRLRRKLELDPSEPAHILTEYGVGYRFVPLPVSAPLGPRAPRRTNLRGPRDGFVGRREELAAIAGALEDAARVLTVKGPGGMGKTRLALHALQPHAAEPPPGGLWMVDLAEARDRTDLLLAVLGVLPDAVAPTSDDELGDEVRRALAARDGAWWILDNAEQIVDQVADTLSDWLDATRTARFVVTSRERLGVPGERVLEVGPLTTADAVALWSLRAEQTGARLEHTDPEVLEALALRLDRIPLALELAAARATSCTASELLGALDARDGLGRLRGVPGRHATLRDCLSWSWDLLASVHREVLAQLSVFRGGFTREAAAAVAECPDASNVLQALVDRSMVQVDRTPDGTRFSLLELVREHAAERLGEGTAAAEDRHIAFFAAAGSEERCERQRHDACVGRATRRDLDNLKAASDRAWSRGRYEASAMAAIAVVVAVTPGQPSVARRYLERALTTPEPLPATVRWRLQNLRIRQHMLESANGEALAGIEAVLAEPALPPETRAALLLLRGGIYLRLRRYDEARAELEDVLALVPDGGPKHAAALGNLAILYEVGERHAEARKHHQKVLELLEAAGREASVPLPLIKLGKLALRAGELEEARRLLHRAITIARAHDASQFHALGLGFLAEVLREEGQALQSLRCARWSVELGERVGDPFLVARAILQQGRALLHLGRLDGASEVLARLSRGAEPYLAEVALRRGDLDEVERLAGVARASLPAGGTHLELVLVTCWQGVAAGRRGDERGARQALADARQAWQRAERPRRPDVLRALHELEAAVRP